MTTYINHMKMCYFRDNDGIFYWFEGGPWTNTRFAKFYPAAWTKRLHGNAPSGTYCGSYRIILPDGSRYTLKSYI